MKGQGTSSCLSPSGNDIESIRRLTIRTNIVRVSLKEAAADDKEVMKAVTK